MESNNDNHFLVYENWRATKKAVVHKSNCGHAKEAHRRIKDEPSAPNDRWFGYFSSLHSAIAFASLLPDRQIKLCGICLKTFKSKV